MRVFLTVMAMAICSPAHGQEYQSRGIGEVSCAVWTSHRRANSEVEGALVAWVLGWLSSASYHGSQDLLVGHDNDALEAWLDNYCAAHPLEYVADATIALERELARTAPRTR